MSISRIQHSDGNVSYCLTKQDHFCSETHDSDGNFIKRTIKNNLCNFSLVTEKTGECFRENSEGRTEMGKIQTVQCTLKTEYEKQQQKSGDCILFIGPMFSGKSTKLCTELTICADIGLKVAYINHAIDERKTKTQDDCVTTHNTTFSKLSDKISKFKIARLDMFTNIDNYDVIGIDEAQFFTNLEENVRNWVLKCNKIVYVSSLDSDFRMQPFGDISKLLPIASHVYKLHAKCLECIKQGHITNAYYTTKIGGDPSKIVEVGCEDKYIPTCLKCHKKYYTQQSLNFPCYD